MTTSELAINQYRIVYANLTSGCISRTQARTLFNEICLDVLSHQNNNQYKRNRFMFEVGMWMCREIFYWGKFVFAHGDWKSKLTPEEQMDVHQKYHRDLETYFYCRSKIRYLSTTIKLCSWQNHENVIKCFGLDYFWSQNELTEREVCSKFVMRCKLNGIRMVGDSVEVWGNIDRSKEKNFNDIGQPLYEDGTVVSDLEYELPEEAVEELKKVTQWGKLWIPTPLYIRPKRKY